MSPEALKEHLLKQPFEPFRIVQTDGTGFDVQHPDMVLVGVRQAIVGLPAKHKPMFYQQTVTVDLLHVIRIEPLPASINSGQKNGPGAS